MASPVTPSSDDDGWLVDNEKSAGSTQPGLPVGASASHAFFGLASISEDGNFDTRSGQSFSRALLLLKHEHERELCAVRARCDLELQSLRGELSVKTPSSGGFGDVPVFGIDRRPHRPLTTSSSQSPPASEAPSFAPDAHVGVFRAESSPSDSSRMQTDLSGKFQAAHEGTGVKMRKLLLDKASNSPEEKSALPQHHAPDVTVERCGALWDLAVVQGRKELAEMVIASSNQTEFTAIISGISKAAQRIARSAFFDGTSGFIILLNCVIMGIGADVAARNRDPDAIPEWCQVASRIFSVWFVIELSFRFLADGKYFWLSKEFTWNMLDLVLVFIDVTEIVIEGSIGRGKMFDASAIRVLRLLRILKTGRVLRLATFCRELRILLACILKCFAPLLWVFLLLTLLIFVFSLFLVQITTGHLAEIEGDTLLEKEAVHREQLIDMFGTMTDALYTLFKAVTGGIGWGVVNAPLIDIHWINGVIFAVYIFFFVFAASNIITSVFVEQALRSAHLDRDELLQAKIEGHNSAYALLKTRLEEADASGSGNLNLQELQKLLKEKTTSAYLRMIGVELDEAWGLCRLLSHKTSETISINEFLVGCLRLNNDVRSIDVALVMYENKQLAAVLGRFLGSNLDMLEEVRHQLKTVVESSLQVLHSDVPPVAQEGSVEQVPGGYTLPHSPREDHTSALLLQSPQTPQSPVVSEGGSPRDTPRSDAPKSDSPKGDAVSPQFGSMPGGHLLSTPASGRPWAGNSTTASCGVPPAVTRSADISM